MFMRSILIMFFGAAVCISGQAQASHYPVEDDIREAVFRYQFHDGRSGQQEKLMVYCLSMGDLSAGHESDPSDAFIYRFRHHRPPVRKQSECTMDVLQGVKDARIGLPGLLFYVANIRWLSNSKAEVTGGYYSDGLSASGNTYTVVQRHGAWTVTHDKLNWISMVQVPSAMHG